MLDPSRLPAAVAFDGATPASLSTAVQASSLAGIVTGPFSFTDSFSRHSKVFCWAPWPHREGKPLCAQRGCIEPQQ